MVKKLYGIVHGGNVGIGESHLLWETINLPSTSLCMELYLLPRSTKVGIEHFAELCQNGKAVKNSIDVDGIEIELSETWKVYWDEILVLCNERGLETVFLDDYATMQEWLRKLMEKERIEGEVKKVIRGEKIIYGNSKNFPEEVKNEIMRLGEEEYKVGVEADYIHRIEREEKLLRIIAQEKPEIVIVGAGHSDYFIAHPEEMHEKGVKFDSYAREEVREEFDLVRSLRSLNGEDSILERGVLIQNSEPKPEILANRESTVRKYNAVKFGRVIPSRKPSFIGTWDVSIPAKGLFEVYVEEEVDEPTGVIAICGNIEDVIGSATFVGARDNRNLKLLKFYDEASIKIGGSEEAIYYEANLDNGRYEGGFSSRKGVYPFWVKEFTE